MASGFLLRGILSGPMGLQCLGASHCFHNEDGMARKLGMHRKKLFKKIIKNILDF
jgi:hypothetical protein